MERLALEECFRVLELRPSAGPRSVKKAFRRLAKEHHPDLNRHPSPEADFIRIVRAYTTLQRAFRSYGGEGESRPCPSCGQIAELFDGLDGGAECAECLLGVSRRRNLLPATPIRMVRHGAVILVEAAAVALLIHGLASGSRSSLVASMVLCAGALAGLAVACAVVRYVR